MVTKTRVIRWFAILKRLWAETRELPEVEVKISDIPTRGKYFFQKGHGFNIHDVLANPEEYNYQYMLIQHENSSTPVMLREETNIPVDGILRIGKALLEGKDTVRAVIISQDRIEQIAPGFDDKRYHPQTLSK